MSKSVSENPELVICSVRDWLNSSVQVITEQDGYIHIIDVAGNCVELPENQAFALAEKLLDYRDRRQEGAEAVPC